MSTNTTPPPVPASRPEEADFTPRRGWPYGAIAAAGILGIFGGLVGGLFIPSPVADDVETVTPTACLDAIDMADEVIAITSGALGSVSEAFGELAEGNVPAAERAMSGIDDDTEELREMRVDYLTAKAECRGS